MNSCTPLRILFAGLAMLAVVPAARAGVADAAPEGLFAGLAHPFCAVDHVLLLVCAGVWAAQLGRRARWTLPALLVSIMACGAALGLRGADPAMLHTMGLMALLAFALLVLGPVRWSFALIAAPLGVVIFFQGVVHAPEIGATGEGLGFTVGLGAGSAVLYVTGLVAGRVILDWIHRHRDHWTGHPGGRLAH